MLQLVLLIILIVVFISATKYFDDNSVPTKVEPKIPETEPVKTVVPVERKRNKYLPYIASTLVVAISLALACAFIFYSL
jgi:hypothetical protein